MAFFLPNFNLLLSFWDSPNTPVGGPPDHVDQPVQVYVSSRGLLDITPGNPSDWIPPIFLRVPLGSHRPTPGDIGGIQPALTDFYKVRWVQNIHMGFANEYINILVEQCDGSGTTPRP